MKYFVASTSDIKQGSIFQKTVEGQNLIFVRYQEQIKAYSGICPHQGAQLATGVIENEAIVCPMHHRAYSCKSGYDIKSHTVLPSFPVEIEGDKLYVILKDENSAKPEPPHRTMADLPQPKGVPILGNLLQFNINNKPKVMENWANECGPTYKISLLGKKFLVSTDPAFHKHLYKNRPDQFRRFGKIDEVMSEMGVNGVFNMEGETWKKHRKLTAEALNARNVLGFFPVIKEITDRLMNRWKQKAAANVIMDIQEEMMRYTVDITTKIAFGYDTHSLEHEEDILQRHLEKILPMINKRMTSPIPFWRYYKSKTDKELDAALASLQGIVQTFIESCRASLAANPALKEDPENFLQALLVQQEQEGKFSDKEIYGNVFTMLLAGEDTTSNSISWALFYLSQHPEIYLKLRQEADLVLGDAPYLQDTASLSHLPYTEAVSMETLRINPVTPTLFFEALEDQVLEGIEVDKGTNIMIQIRMAQTSNVHFTDGDKFIPERWLDNSPCPMHNMDVFYTFGAGPRFCPGKNLAVNEMKVALSMIAKNFDIELTVAPEEVRDVFAFTMYPENLMMKITVRK